MRITYKNDPNLPFRIRRRLESRRTTGSVKGDYKNIQISPTFSDQFHLHSNLAIFQSSNFLAQSILPIQRKKKLQRYREFPTREAFRVVPLIISARCGARPFRPVLCGLNLKFADAMLDLHKPFRGGTLAEADKVRMERRKKPSGVTLQ